MKIDRSIIFFPNATKWMQFYYMFIKKQDNFEVSPVLAAGTEGREHLL